MNADPRAQIFSENYNRYGLFSVEESSRSDDANYAFSRFCNVAFWKPSTLVWSVTLPFDEDNTDLKVGVMKDLL